MAERVLVGVGPAPSSQRLVRATFGMSWEYRFIYRELIALLHQDLLELLEVALPHGGFPFVSLYL